MLQVLECVPAIFPPRPSGVLQPGISWPSMPPIGLGDCGLVRDKDSPPVVRAEDEDVDEDEDVPEAEVLPPAEPLETTSDFDEDDFDDEFDDDFEEEFDEDEFGSEVTPEDLESDDEDSFEEGG
jgi:hypothetical protein